MKSLKLTILSVIAEGKVGMGIPSRLYEEVNVRWSCSEEAFTQTVRDLYQESAIIATNSWNGGIVRVSGLTAYGRILLQNS